MAMSGCSAANTLRKLDAAEDRVEAKLDAAEEKLENRIRDNAGPSSSAAEASSALLTEEQVRQIALDYLGIPGEQAERMRIQYEMDDGIPQFDVTVLQGDWEHEFEIHAETGKILSYEKDHKYD